MIFFSICETPDILRVIYFIKILINIVKILIPIILILLVTIDCAKGVINSSEKVEDILKINKNKLISALLIFTIPSIINIFLEVIDEETSYESCWANANPSTIEEFQRLLDKDEEGENQGQPQQNNTVISSPNILFAYEYHSDNQTLPYGLFTPSTAKTNKMTPLIIWLHGSGEVYKAGSSLIGTGMLKVINEWKLDGFNAYILCPHLTGDKVISGDWASNKKEFYKLVDKIIKEKNINKNNVSIIGHSLGGSGVIYMSYDKTEYYSSVVILSAYSSPSYSELSSLKKLPVRGYTENSGGALSFTNDLFTSVFGKDKLTILNGIAHGEVPKIALTEDKNKDNKSDLIEWMLNQEK